MLLTHCNQRRRHEIVRICMEALRPLSVNAAAWRKPL